MEFHERETLNSFWSKYLRSPFNGKPESLLQIVLSAGKIIRIALPEVLSGMAWFDNVSGEVQSFSATHSTLQGGGVQQD